VKHFVYGIVVGGVMAGGPILLVVYELKKFLEAFRQDAHELLPYSREVAFY
jgi:hypothetical protein